MKTLPEDILAHARSLPEGGIVSPKAFLHLGSRSAIDQALSRLAREGKLLRVARGAYVAPVTGRFGTRPPAPSKVVESLAIQNGETVVPHGATVANAFGLTQQVPIREAYVTSGRTRKIRLGRAEILVKHGPGWMLTLGNCPAGNAIRALAWLGPRLARQSVPIVRRTLSGDEWAALTTVRASLPSWLARAIGEEASNGRAVS
ncbi:hypothetical protein E6C76_21110 [Pseudothauera nasutitermitis]|uniref:Transcriptional regulator, AbiEi antitoxin, Type IV TA system n=2 Tax=Pseudothauera nasutitermitis TaxID=2565930 RepID=A0A4S4AN83_9RHOO|nr:DUF6088 family protein [Pseudothauera nasutitermitis]THF61094.1 hypothetical protein E6C76_21110 [Pseudothauera nasutitermitis]